MDSRECFIPALRFTGFEDCWKEYRLGDFSQSIKRVVSDTQVHIMMITAQNGFINQSDRYSFNNAGESLKKYIELHKGELAYNHGASKLRPFGSCFSLQIDKARIPFVYHCFSIKENDPEFISLVLNNKNTEGQLRKIVTSGARMDGLLNISFEQYCSLNLKIPSLKEQYVIADFFKSLDSMITLTSKKIEKLKQALTGCMQTMFPLEGELEPKIRFKEFKGKWGENKALNIFSPINEKNRPDLPVLSANQNVRGMAPRSETGYQISHDKRNEVGYKHVLPGQFVMHLRSFQGGFAHASLEGITSPAYTVFGLKDTSAHYDMYWKYVFMSEEFVHRLITITYGIRDGRSISFDEFTKMNFIFPSYDEQKKIADYITTFYEVVALQTKRLDLLKHIKSACLDNMFI